MRHFRLLVMLSAGFLLVVSACDPSTLPQRVPQEEPNGEGELLMTSQFSGVFGKWLRADQATGENLAIRHDRHIEIVRYWSRKDASGNPGQPCLIRLSGSDLSAFPIKQPDARSCLGFRHYFAFRVDQLEVAAEEPDQETCGRLLKERDTARFMKAEYDRAVFRLDEGRLAFCRAGTFERKGD